MMVRHIATLLLLPIWLISLSGCSATRGYLQQRDYHRELDRLVEADLPVEEKVNLAAEVIEKVLLEAMEYSSDRRTLKHIHRFNERNKATLNALLDQVETHIKTLNPLDRLFFIRKILRQPYVRALEQLLPKVEKKINRRIRQFRFFQRFFNLLFPDWLL